MMFILHGSWFASGKGHGHSHGNGHQHSHGSSHIHTDTYSVTAASSKSFIKNDALKTTDNVPSRENIVIIDETKLLQQPG